MIPMLEVSMVIELFREPFLHVALGDGSVFSVVDIWIPLDRGLYLGSSGLDVDTSIGMVKFSLDLRVTFFVEGLGGVYFMFWVKLIWVVCFEVGYLSIQFPLLEFVNTFLADVTLQMFALY